MLAKVRMPTGMKTLPTRKITITIKFHVGQFRVDQFGVGQTHMGHAHVFQTRVGQSHVGPSQAGQSHVILCGSRKHARVKNFFVS